MGDYCAFICGAKKTLWFIPIRSMIIHKLLFSFQLHDYYHIFEGNLEKKILTKYRTRKIKKNISYLRNSGNAHMLVLQFISQDD